MCCGSCVSIRTCVHTNTHTSTINQCKKEERKEGKKKGKKTEKRGVLFVFYQDPLVSNSFGQAPIHGNILNMHIQSYTMTRVYFMSTITLPSQTGD